MNEKLEKLRSLHRALGKEILKNLTDYGYEITHALLKRDLEERNIIKTDEEITDIIKKMIDTSTNN